MATSVISLLQAAIIFGTVIMFGAIGEIIAEKSGSLNLGVPGIMYLGGIAGLTGVFFYENSWFVSVSGHSSAAPPRNIPLAARC